MYLGSSSETGWLLWLLPLAPAKSCHLGLWLPELPLVREVTSSIDVCAGESSFPVWNGSSFITTETRRKSSLSSSANVGSMPGQWMITPAGVMVEMRPCALPWSGVKVGDDRVVPAIPEKCVVSILWYVEAELDNTTG